jgi:hypothetical protein
MGTSFAVFLANFSLFSYEFDFLKHLLKNNTFPIVLHRVSLSIALWMIFLFLIFQTLRVLST